MRDDYVYFADPKDRAKSKGDRAVKYIKECLEDPTEDRNKIWKKTRSRFLYDLRSRYKEVGGTEIYEAVREFWWHCKHLDKTAKILNKIPTKSLDTFQLTRNQVHGVDTLNQLKMLYALGKCELDKEGE